MSVTPDKTTHSGNAMFAALNNIQFRWLLASNLFFFLAMNGQMLTRSVLAWHMTSNEMALAYINAAYAAPMIVFALIGGALTDRFERRGLTQLCQLLLTANEVAIWILLMIDQLQFWHLICAGIFGGMVNPVVMASRTSLVFNTVGAAKLGNATALSTGVVNITRVVGPMIMGALVAGVNIATAYLLAVMLFSASYICLFRLDKKDSHLSSDTSQPPLLQDIRSGISYIKNSRPILVCLLFGFLPASLAIPAQNLLILFTDNVWQVGESGLGLLMAGAGLGGIAGSFWVARRGESPRRAKPMIVAAMAFAVFLALFSASPTIYLGLFALLCANACSSAALTLNNTTMQLIVDDSRRGRVSSFMMMAYGFTPLGVLPLAWLAKSFGVNWVLCGASIGLIFVVGAFYRMSSSLRAMDQSVSYALHSKHKVSTTSST